MHIQTSQHSQTEYLWSLSADAGCPCLELDGEGRITHANAAGCDCLGCAETQLVGRHTDRFFCFLHVGSQDTGDMTRVGLESSAIEVFGFLRCRDGRRQPFEGLIANGEPGERRRLLIIETSSAP